MRGLVSIGVSALCAVMLTENAVGDTAVVNGITWTYTVNNGVASVGGGTYSSTAVYTATTGAIAIPSRLGGYSVTSIGNYAFYNCSGLTSVTIPDSVMSIGSGAFEGCSGLTSVTIPDSVTRIYNNAFEGCRCLTSVTIPGSVMHFGSEAFRNCTGLTNVTIGNGVTSIGVSAFSGCSGLTSVTIPNSVTNIWDGAFSGCSGLTSVTIPGSVTSLWDDVFSGCTGLTSVYIKDLSAWCGISFRNLSANPLYYAHNIYLNNELIEELIIPTCITDVGKCAFAGCSNIVSVTIPNSVTNIGNSAFYGCSSLTSIYVDDIAAWCEISSALSYYAHDLYLQGELVEELTIPRSVTSIGTTFRNCTSITRVIIPHSVTKIGSYAFSGCSNLETIIVPNTLSVGGLVLQDSVEVVRYKPRQVVSLDVADGAVSPETIDVTYGEAYGSIPTPSRLGHQFVQWEYDGTVINSDTEVSAIDDHTLTAIWTRKPIFSDSISAESIGGKTMKDLYPYDYADMTEVVLEDGIVELPSGFFDGCDSIVSITLPSTLETIGLDVLPPRIRESLRYDENGFMIYGGWILGYRDTKVTDLVLPDAFGVGTQAFAGFTRLETVVMPDALRYIGKQAFKNCYYLDNVAVPDNVEKIGNEAFMNCTEMQTIVMGSSLREVGESAFENCISLSKVGFADGLESLGARAFAGPMRLMSVSLPASMTEIGEDAFLGCEHLIGVTVPTHLMTLSDIFPNSYASITSVVMADGVTNTVDLICAGCLSLTDVTMPDSLVAIGECAFSNCVALAELALPNSVYRLGAGSFSSCTNLHTVALSKVLARVEDRTFEKCPMLDSLVVPASVQSVGANIYSGTDIYDWNYLQNDHMRFTASLTGVYYLGNAPIMDDLSYAGMPVGMKSYVAKGSTGWYLDGSPTLPPGGWPARYARAITYWAPNRFDVMFDANGGVPATYAAEQITDTTYSLPRINPSREGYRFVGWWTEREDGAQVTANTRVTLTKEHTLYAHWQPLSDVMTVLFNANGGTVLPDSASYQVGSTYGQLPVPTRIGCRFVGWYTSPVEGILVTEASEVQLENNELYAHWAPIVYVVRFNANGGVGSMDDELHTYNEAKALHDVGFTRVGHVFAGWARSAGGEVVYANKAVVENLSEKESDIVTLYAVWNVATYAIRFDGNGGVGLMDNQTFQVGVAQTLSECLFRYDGCVFIGWSTSADGEVEYEDGEIVVNLATLANSTVSLYAVWAQDTSNVTFTFGGDKPWRPARSARDGEAVWQSGKIGDNETSDIIATVSGCGTVSFDWSSSCEESYRGMRLDYIAFFIDGEEKCFLDGSSPWESKSYTIDTDGLHTLMWRYKKDIEGYKYEDCARIAKVIWEPSLSTLAEFANSADLEFSTSLASPWFGQTVVAHDNIAALRSGVISDDEESRIECEVNGAGELSFWWKVSCEEPFRGTPLDYVSFDVDGVQKVWIAGETDWTNVIMSIDGGGKHKLSWIYQKDDWPDSKSGEDCAWLDEVTWTPSAAVPIPEVAPDAGAATVNAVVDGVGFADVGVKSVIGGSAAEYTAFKEWAQGVKGAGSGSMGTSSPTIAGEAAVVANTNAAAAYLLGAERLFENAPKVEFGELAVGEANDGGALGITRPTMTVSVTVKDGEEAVKCAAEKVKAMFEATSDLGDWNGAAKMSPTVTIEQGEGATMRFKVTPGDGTAAKAFLRIRK